MMRKQRTKEMTGHEKELVNKTEETITDSVPKKIMCIKECDMPWVGAFKAGQVIDDPKLIEKISDNPNFETVKQEA